MSALQGAKHEFGCAVSDFDAVLRTSEAWQDDQRRRLERAQLIPLRAAANDYLQAIQRADEAVAAAMRLLAE